MNVEEYKKLARNKIKAEALTKQVRDIIKTTKWQKQDLKEGFKETFKPHLLNLKIAFKKVLMRSKTQLLNNVKNINLLLHKELIKTDLQLQKDLTNLMK